MASPSFVLEKAFLVDCMLRFYLPKAISCGQPPLLRSASPGFRNSGFENSMFEPWVRELYVRTPGSNSVFEPWVRNSMFKSRVRELCVRTLGSGTLCSNLGLGNFMFEPWVRGTLCSSPWVRQLHAPGFMVYPGSNIEFPNPGFEHRVPEPGVRT